MMLENLAAKYASDFNIDHDLVYSIINVESGWNPYAMRFEPNYKWLYEYRVYAGLLNITEQTEETLQKMSYGLFQLMGALCREYGFKEELVKLCDPEINLKYGCMHLKKLINKYSNEQDVIAAYNAGTPRKTEGGLFYNQKYVDKVYSFLNAFRKLK